MDIEALSLLSLKDLQAAYRSRTLSPVEVVDAMLAQIEATNNDLNALYGIRYSQARDEAQAAEKRYAEKHPISDYDGVPVTIKDSVNAVGMTWHHGSAIHGDGIVGTKDSPPVVRLKKAGAIILAKCTMPDYGLSGSGVSGSHGITRNPWGLEWNTGGSSAGGGASIAAGIGMMSVGSDIAGSVRLPAAHCGLAALKPTQGIIPHAPASTVRSAGPITRQAADLDAWTRLLIGPDDVDRYSVPYNESPNNAAISVAASVNFGFGPPVEKAVLECVENVRVTLSELIGDIPYSQKKANFDAYIPIDDSLKLRGWLEYSSADPSLQKHTPSCLHSWFKEAEFWTANRIGEMEQEIERTVAYCVDLLADVDFLLTPVMPVVNFPAEDRGIDPTMPLRHTTFTSLFNQSGNPAVSLCGGFDERGLPIGVQLVGKRLDDARLLSLATKLEKKMSIYGENQQQWPVVPIERTLEVSV